MGAMFSIIDAGFDGSGDVVGLNTAFNTVQTSNHSACPVDTPWSCSVGGGDTCCYEGQNGLFLQTQFWDYDPATGADDTWTLHGLWSDKCQGGFRQFCNKDWMIDSARDTLLGLGMDELVDRMNDVWKNLGGNDNSLWTHEFNKHGTCMSTVSPSCYPADAVNQNVGDFFRSAVALYDTLPTYEWLAEEGILPSYDRQYSVAEFSSAILKHTGGKTVFLGCDRSNNVNQVWYYYKLRGSVADGSFEQINSINTPSCTDGFRYLPKRGDDTPGFPSPPRPGKGDKKRQHLYVVNKKGKREGCVISDGSWYRDGTCATFQVIEDVDGVHLTSSKGDCGASSGVLKCNRRVEWQDFTLDEDGFVGHGGDFTWFARKTPKKRERMPLSTSAGDVKIRLQLD